MSGNELFEQLLRFKHDIITQGKPEGVALLKQISKIHPADIAHFFEQLEPREALDFFMLLPRDVQLRVFDEVHHSLKVTLLESFAEHERAAFLTHLSIDDLTDFFDDLSDIELSRYLKLLHKKDRARVVSLLQFDPESAGGIMYTDVLTLMQDFTVAKSIHILQRLRPNRALHHKIYITNQNNELLGHINLEDLVLKSPNSRLDSIIRTDELIVNVSEDRQEVAKKMIHYGLTNVPVIGDDRNFLGVIPSEALVEIVEEEASEDIYRMSALTPIKYSYFETPFRTLLYQRSSILIVLLMVQTLSSIIISRYEKLLYGFLTYFISMLTSSGGNASSQTSALAIQGMATGEIDDTSSIRFVRRELVMATIIGLLLGFFSFVRTYGMYLMFGSPFYLQGTVAVSISLTLIVFVSVLLGSSMPFILKRIGVDPAHSAGPLLTTVIDVVGLLIYCLVGSLIMHYFR